MSGHVVAELDRRFHAYAVDLALGGGVTLGLAFLARDHLPPGHASLLLLAFLALAVAAGLAAALGTTGRTPGLSLLGLRVVAIADGRPIGLGPAALRVLVVGLATVPCGLGLAALAWTALTDPAGRRRGWHDRLVGSVVVETRARPGEPEREPEPAGPPEVVNLTAARLVPVRRTTVAPRGATARPPRAVAAPRPISWGLLLDSGHLAAVDPVVVIGGPACRARVELATDGALVVTALGPDDGTLLRRRRAVRPLGTGCPATLLEGDVVVVGGHTATVVGRD